MHFCKAFKVSFFNRAQSSTSDSPIRRAELERRVEDERTVSDVYSDIPTLLSGFSGIISSKLSRIPTH